jgi:hypothetical protein
MTKPEIILNLWYVHDDLGYIYSLRARAYLGYGSEQEKLAFLQQFARSDYLIARPFKIPKLWWLEGRPVFHQAVLQTWPSAIPLFLEAIRTLQAELPSQTPFDIPLRPLVCITPLLGDDDGHIRPADEARPN